MCSHSDTDINKNIASAYRHGLGFPASMAHLSQSACRLLFPVQGSRHEQGSHLRRQRASCPHGNLKRTWWWCLRLSWSSPVRCRPQPQSAAASRFAKRQRLVEWHRGSPQPPPWASRSLYCREKRKEKLFWSNTTPSEFSFLLITWLVHWRDDGYNSHNCTHWLKRAILLHVNLQPHTAPERKKVCHYRCFLSRLPFHAQPVCQLRAKWSDLREKNSWVLPRRSTCCRCGEEFASGMYFLIKDYQQPSACWEPQSGFGQSGKPLSIWFTPKISQCHALAFSTG